MSHFVFKPKEVGGDLVQHLVALTGPAARTTASNASATSILMRQALEWRPPGWAASVTSGRAGISPARSSALRSDHRHARAAVAALQRLAHQIDVADAFEAVSAPPSVSATRCCTSLRPPPSGLRSASCRSAPQGTCDAD